MALNFPGPYEVELTYSTAPPGLGYQEHKMRLNVNVSGSPAPGSDMTTISFLQRDLDTIAADLAITGFVNGYLAPNFNTANTDFAVADLYEYTPGTFDRTFISTLQIGVGGLNAAGNSPAGQVILTFRTQEGGIMKISLMEAIHTPGQRQLLPVGTAAIDDLVNFVVSPDNWILARDTSYPIAPIAYSPGTNEAVFKKRFRA